MKKAFSLKKKLPKVLAVALAAACFAGAVPANAAGVTRAYSTIGNYGSFEEYMWRLSDNTSGDILSFNAENQPVVTKGTGADGTEGTSLASRRIALAAGNYQLSFTVKASTQGYYIAGGYGFDSAGSPKEIKYTNTHEGIIGTEWTSVTAEFTVPEGYTSNEFRLFLRGNSGDRITVKDLDVKKIEERVKSRDVATLDGWTGSYFGNSSLAYSNPDIDTCRISVVDDGADDAGAVYIHRENTDADGRPTARILYQIQNSVLSQYDVGTEFVLEAKTKGYSASADSMKFSLEQSPYSWSDGSEDTYNYALKSYDKWVTFTKEFKKNAAGDLFIIIRSGGYTAADLYIDNIKVYAKDDESRTNLISKGNFYTTEPATTLDGWTGSYYGNPSLAYNNPDTDTCRITVVNEGANDAGAVYFHRENTDADGRPTARIIYKISNGALEKYDVGTEFVLEAKTKGKSPSPGNDSMKFSLESSPYAWTDGSDVVYNYELNSSSWVTFTKEFKKNAAGDLFIIVRSGGYTAADFYLDNVKVYAKNDESKTNLIANGDFCEKEVVVSDSSAVDNSPYKVNNVPGFDIGMLNDVLGGDKDISVVPGGSYDGSAAVEIRGGDSAERYFQQLDTDAVKFVLGDTAVKATGYFKVTAGNTEPKIWLGFGKSYGGGNSVGLHFANYLKNGKADSGESFTARDDGWYYFEKTVDTGTFNNKIKSMTELVWVKYMCGIDARTNTGAARFDNITCEIISSAEPGDANNDGEINILDMVRMKKYSAGNESFENITRGMWLTENTDGAAALAALKKVIIGVSSEYGK